MDSVYDEFVTNFRDCILLNEPMKKHTSFGTGGCADLLFVPRKIKDISNAIHLCKSSGIQFYVMGNGSNLLIKDTGFKGIIIKISSNLKNYDISDTSITCESGILLCNLAKVALTNNLTGFEFASGIPGTLGGAVSMNAGAYGGEMKDVVSSSTVLTQDGDILTLSNQELKLAYRTSKVQQERYVVLKATISLAKGEYLQIESRMNELKEMRSNKQPLEYPSAGSTFKRPEGYFAGKLIMDSGLRGYSIGGAQVSEKHCGFIINKGTATATDILNLIEHITDTVYKKFNIQLEPEVKIIG
jgi:UDP-N-acetylmuramate dehydrogenase